jgi:hypothetical protein
MKKKFISIIIAMAIMVTTIPVIVVALENLDDDCKCHMRGDVNNDGFVCASDAEEIYKYLSNQVSAISDRNRVVPPSKQSAFNSGIVERNHVSIPYDYPYGDNSNHDLRPNINDVLEILKHASGIKNNAFTAVTFNCCCDNCKHVLSRDCECCCRDCRRIKEPETDFWACYCREKGDVNNDGVIDIKDVMEVLKYLAGIDSILDLSNCPHHSCGVGSCETKSARNAAMITQRSNPSITDALEILKHLAGLPSRLG